jgi:hypothetical protein
MKTTVRAAGFRTFKRELISNQTLEPTQVSGFNQFYDDSNRTEAWLYGAAVDQVFGQRLFGGLEYLTRDLTISVEDFNGFHQSFEWDEKTARGYFFWTPHDWVSASLEYSYSYFERDLRFVGEENFIDLKTHKLPIGIHCFFPNGLFFHWITTYVNQSGAIIEGVNVKTVEEGDQFWVVDVAVGYRLPKRLGIFSLDAKNLLDEGFRFQDTDPANPEIIPERSFLAKITLAF